MIVGIEDHEEYEFSIGDVAHKHRLFDVYAMPGDRGRCMVEVQCPHCCRLNHIPVTIKRGLPAGPGGRIRCEFCNLREELFTIDENRGRIQLYSRRKGSMVSVTMADAVKVYRDYRRTMVDLAKDAKQQDTTANAPAEDTTYVVIPLGRQIAT
jgi:hypothetical protein